MHEPSDKVMLLRLVRMRLSQVHSARAWTASKNMTQLHGTMQTGGFLLVHHNIILRGMSGAAWNPGI